MLIKEYTEFDLNEILLLYESVGWTNYTSKPTMLENAFRNSLLVLGAYDNDKLVGVVRVVGDEWSVIYVQDMLVMPSHQRKGIGTSLMREVMERYKNTYQMTLLTDNNEKNKAFYRSLGFVNATDIHAVAFFKENK
ncbi:MAG: GNAT family N-acetyltransferase [Oscillospiraceae bacterium]|nr:GNAT family N-acetyltransferase [Oscillospiraceae bacterium]